MVRIKKIRITEQAPLLQKKRVCLEIGWRSVWNTEHATLLKHNYPPKCLDS